MIYGIVKVVVVGSEEKAAYPLPKM